MEVAVVLLAKASAHDNSIFLFLPCDDRLGRAEHVTDQDGRLTLGYFGDSRQRVDEAWWLS